MLLRPTELSYTLIIHKLNLRDLTVIFCPLSHFNITVYQLDFLFHVIVALTLGFILVEQKLLRTLLVTMAKEKA